MRLPLSTVVIAALGCITFDTARADWLVARLSGDAVATAPGQPATVLSASLQVPDTVTIETGVAGHVMLRRGASLLVIGPQTSLTVEVRPFAGTVTVLQRVGRVGYQVEKRKLRYFSVETPFMVATVKGTEFVVRVSNERATVAVEEGLVGVMALPAGASADLRAGQKASSVRDGLVCSGTGRGQVGKGTRRAPLIEPMSAGAVAARVRAVIAGIRKAASATGRRPGERAAETLESVSGSGPVSGGVSAATGLGNAGLGVSIDDGGLGIGVGLGGIGVTIGAGGGRP
jgi:hypothetical protein